MREEPCGGARALGVSGRTGPSAAPAPHGPRRPPATPPDPARPPARSMPRVRGDTGAIRERTGERLEAPPRELREEAGRECRVLLGGV